MENVFDGLMSLKDAADMWKLEESTLRKAIASNKFSVGTEVKKFGKQWVIKIEAMERVYGVLISSDEFEEPDRSKAEDIYYFIFECCNAYANKYKVSKNEVIKEFKKYNIYEYIYECFDYLHLLSINENVIDFRSRIKRGVVYD